MAKGKRSALYFPGVFLAALVAVIIGLRGAGFDIKTAVMTLIGMGGLGLHGLFGFGLIFHQTLSSHPVTDYVDLGYWKSLQLKWLYICRYHFNDNDLWDDWHDKLTEEIVAMLEARGEKKDNDKIYSIPTFEFDEIDAKTFYNNYVKKGRPAILRNAKIRAMNWTPENIALGPTGAHRNPMKCPKAGGTKTMSVHEYVTGKNVSGTDPCYLDNNANIFAEYPDFHADLEMWRFSEYMFGTPTPEGVDSPGYLFSQLFMGVFPSLGITYHCANFHNLFFMIHGRKKWTFIDPSNSWFVYPGFNKLMRFVASKVTWEATHAHNASDVIAKHYPLLRYAPKYTFTLERGDLLINPAWNYHMVENVDTESIGVASRWHMPAFYPYTNALFSFLQFTSLDFWGSLYWNIAKKNGLISELPYNPGAHAPYDGLVNFGKTGSMWKKRHFWKEVTSPTYWNGYLEFLKTKSAEDGVDYLKEE